jgi:choline dehydrogenase-like flavoprotein
LEDGKHPNLHVLVESQVESIIFDGKRAVGVRYRPNPAFYNTSTDSTNKTHEIGARRMVIVSCGALGTPAVLERSGIGSASILQRAKIPIISDLPGVGQNYGDHGGMIYSYQSSLPPSETLDAVARTMANPAELIRQKEPILAWNGMDITSKVRPSEKEIGAMGLDFQEYWEENYKAFEDKPVSILTLIAG